MPKLKTVKSLEIQINFIHVPLYKVLKEKKNNRTQDLERWKKLQNMKSESDKAYHIFLTFTVTFWSLNSFGIV